MVRFNADHTHVCKRCGITYWSTKKTQVYCTVRCRVGAHHGNSETCYNCGKPTQDGRLYCSLRCARNYNARMSGRRRKPRQI